MEARAERRDICWSLPILRYLVRVSRNFCVDLCSHSEENVDLGALVCSWTRISVSSNATTRKWWGSWHLFDALCCFALLLILSCRSSLTSRFAISVYALVGLKVLHWYASKQGSVQNVVQPVLRATAIPRRTTVWSPFQASVCPNEWLRTGFLPRMSSNATKILSSVVVGLRSWVIMQQPSEEAVIQHATHSLYPSSQWRRKQIWWGHIT